MSDNSITSLMAKNRFHSTVWSIVLHYTVMAEVRNSRRPQPKNSLLLHRLIASTGKYDLRFSSEETIDRALKNQFPMSIQFDLEPRRYDRPREYNEKVVNLTSVSLQTVEAFFALAAEKAVNWVRSTSPKIQPLPPITDFARVVRNAIVHGGTVNTRNVDGPTATWREVAYDHKSYGRQIRSDLYPADLICLIFDLDAELAQLGAPCPLPST